MNEIWKPIEWLNNEYEVSTYGCVRSVKTGHIMTPFKNAKGYLKLRVTYDEGKRKSFRINRAVALAFIPNPENKPQVNHIDFDKTNNRVDNLEWMTNSENQEHAQRMRKLLKEKS